MTEDERPLSIKALESRIRKARGVHSAPNSAPFRPSPAGQVLRLGVEMASSLFVGALLGWLLDRWLDTGPWLLLVFLLFGGAGGLLNVYRTGIRLNAQAEEGQQTEGKNN